MKMIIYLTEDEGTELFTEICSAVDHAFDPSLPEKLMTACKEARAATVAVMEILERYGIVMEDE